MGTEQQYFFTSDEHYDHKNIIKYTSRPFENVEEMNEELIKRNNKIVSPNDIVIHAGDFCWAKTYQEAQKHIDRLNGNHVFLLGSHDKWLKGKSRWQVVWERMIEGQFIVVYHYCLRVWARSHYNSWHLYGHSHGHLDPIGKSWDIGVDSNNFYPVSFNKVSKIMEDRPDNPNLVKHKHRH